MPTKEELSLVSRRKKWLAKSKLTIREFADKADVDYGSAYRWMTEPRRLHKLYAERVAETHKGFPLR